MLIHVVMAGETIELLARTYSVSPQRIISDNGLLYPYQLTVGQALIITQVRQMHVVSPGETVYSIAVAYQMSVQELYQNNPELSSDPLLAGQAITISFNSRKVNTALSVLGYAYPFINETILLRALPFLSYLSIFSYSFRPDGSLRAAQDEALIQAARSYQVHPLLVLSSLDENENFSSELVHEFLNNEEAQNTLLYQNLIPVLIEKGYRGLDIDFEYIPAEDAGKFIIFLKKAQTALHQNGMTLNVALAPKNNADQPGLLYEGLDYRAIGEIADTVFLMTYDWGYLGGPPFPISPVNEVERVLQYALSVIPNDKLMMGIPNYGYNWSLPFVAGESTTVSIGNLEAVQLAARNNSPILFDELAQSPYFYYSEAGTDHVVWFEDVRSFDAEYQLQQKYNLCGVGYWNVMRPFPQNWAYLSTNYNIAKFL